VSGFSFITSEKITTTVDGKISWGERTLTITAEKLQEKPKTDTGLGFTHSGEAHFTYSFVDSDGKTKKFSGIQELRMQIEELTTQPAAPAPAAGGKLTITAMGCFVAPQEAKAVYCIPAIINIPSGTKPNFEWKIDDQPPVTSEVQGVIFKEVTSGEHSVTLTAKTGDQTAGPHTTIFLVPEVGSKAPFSVKLNCTVSGTVPNRSATCTATSDGSTLSYKWYSEGMANAEQGNTLTLSNLDGRQYGLQVRVTDSSGNSVIASHVIPCVKNGKAAALNSGQVQVSSGNGSTVLTPGQSTTVAVKPDQPVQVTSKCNLDDFMRMSVKYGDPRFMVHFKNGEQIDVRMLIQYLKCVQKEQSNHYQEGVSPVSFRQPQPSSDLSFQAEAEVPDGSLRFQVEDDQALFTVVTANLTVTSRGKNDFEVAYDTVSKQSTVAAYQGSVEIQPQNTALESVTLQAGNMVQVTQDNISPPAAVKASPTSSIDNTTLSILGITCCCGFALVIIIIVVSIILLRRRSSNAPKY
jgi:hypothetical protein